QRVVHRDEGTVEGRGPPRVHERRRRTLCKRLRDERVPVEALAFERDEEIAGVERTRVRDDARERRGRTEDASVHGRGSGRRVHHATSTACSASRAAARSEKGRRTPAVSW